MSFIPERKWIIGTVTYRWWIQMDIIFRTVKKWEYLRADGKQHSER